MSTVFNPFSTPNTRGRVVGGVGFGGGKAKTIGISDWEETSFYKGQEVLTKRLLKRNSQFGMTSTPISCAYVSKLALKSALSWALGSGLWVPCARGFALVPRGI